MRQRALAAEFNWHIRADVVCPRRCLLFVRRPIGAAGILVVAFSLGFTVSALAFSIEHISGATSIPRAGARC
jgi:hypothetical protein